MEVAIPVSHGRPVKTSADRPIDLVHLSRMTFGDRALEREVLHLFARQSEQILGKLKAADTEEVRLLAHTLKGSAKGVGAWAVAEAADALEQSARTGHTDQAVGRLRASVAEATRMVEDLLGAH